ncbi:hypothetical protein [Nonomuraea jabiensis]
MFRHVVELIAEEPFRSGTPPEGVTAPVRYGPRSAARVAEAETTGSDA